MLASVLLLPLSPAAQVSAAQARVSSCRHSYGLFSWAISSPVRGDVQRAYELEVFHANGTIAWSAVTSEVAQSRAIDSLRPSRTYSWRLRVWLSGSAGPTAWGCAGTEFDTPPGADVFPGASAWIGGGGQLRTRTGLSLPAGTIARARAWVSGVGAFYLFANGVRVGENVMDPQQSVTVRPSCSPPSTWADCSRQGAQTTLARCSARTSSATTTSGAT